MDAFLSSGSEVLLSIPERWLAPRVHLEMWLQLQPATGCSGSSNVIYWSSPLLGIGEGAKPDSRQGSIRKY